MIRGLGKDWLLKLRAYVLSGESVSAVDQEPPHVYKAAACAAP